MRQLNFVKPRVLEWHEAAAPTLPSGDAALVRPVVVSTCDMDGFVIGGGVPFRGPVPVGHEGVAEVLEVGDAVGTVRPGDRVIVPWKISCGACGKCRLGLTAHCTAVAPEAAYSWGPTAREWGGFLADVVAVPWADHMLCPLPEGIDPVAASGVSDNITDAWRAVGPGLRSRPGGAVLIVGGGGPGSIGLFSAGLARALGAGAVTYVDHDPGRRAVAAERYGAAAPDGMLEDLSEEYDVIVDASGDPHLLEAMLRVTAPGAIVTCTSGAVYFQRPVAFPVFAMYRRGVTFRTGWANTRPAMHEPLALIAEGAFDPRAVETAVVSFEDAAGALAEPFTKLVLAA